MRRSAAERHHSQPGGLRREQVGGGAGSGDSLQALAGKLFLAAAPFVILMGLLIAHRWLFR